MGFDETPTGSRREVLRAFGAGALPLTPASMQYRDEKQRSGSEEPGEILVGLSGRNSIGTATATVQSEVLPTGAEVLSRNETLGYLRVRIPEETEREDTVARIASRGDAHPDVRYVETNHYAYPQSLPNDPFTEHSFRNQYGLHLVNAPDAWELANDEAAVSIGIVDQGVLYDHTDLKAQFGDNKGRDIYNDDPDPYPESLEGNRQEVEGHGTHVAGIAAGTRNNRTGIAGIADARLLACRVLGGENGRGPLSAIADGVQYAADQGVDVINLSLGGTNTSQTLHDAIKYAANRDVVIIAAAGNRGRQGGEVLYPAKFDETIAVSNITPNLALNPSSSAGPAVDIAAPGSMVLSTFVHSGREDNRLPYAALTGTSMAAPMVAGAAALLRSHEPELSREQVEQRLLDTARDIGLDETEQGNGLLDMRALIANDRASDTGPTATATLSPGTIQLGETTTLDASESAVPDGEIDRYEWFTYGNRYASGETVEFEPRRSTWKDTRPITLRVTTADGRVAYDSVEIAVEPRDSPDEIPRNNANPTAVIDTDTTVTTVGESITFDASQSSDPDDDELQRYVWHFGQGAKKEGQTVSHAFDESGEYIVSLRVRDEAYRTGLAEIQVSVEDDGGTDDPLTVSITPPTPTVKPEESLTLEADAAASGGSITSYSWEFDDGTTATGKSTTRTFSSAGSYSVTLTVTDDAGHEATVSTEVTVTTSDGNTSPTVTITPTAPTVTAGDSITFDGSSSTDPDGTIDAYEWVFQDGITATGPKTTQTFEQPGGYSASLTVTDDDGTTASASTPIIVKPGDSEDSRFEPGASVVTLTNLNTRSAPDGALEATLSPGTEGTLREGPREQAGYTWWKVDWSSGITGWSAAQYLGLYYQPGGEIADETTVRTTEPLNVRTAPDTGQDRLGTAARGATGTVIGGAVDNEDYTWWKIAYNQGYTGWSVARHLTAVSSDDGDCSGDEVVTTVELSIRTDPDLQARRIGVAPVGTRGQICAGPRRADGYTWWKVIYDDGTSGWSVDRYLDR